MAPRDIAGNLLARLMQFGERLHNHTIGLHELLCAFRFARAAAAPHAKPCHGTFSPLSSVLTSSSQKLRPPFGQKIKTVEKTVNCAALA
jgi:hypothetical protein